MDERCKEIQKQGDYLFGKKTGLDNLNQTIAENFYVERSDFTGPLSLSDEFADHLTTSYPLMAHRDLSNSLGAMLRPISKEWFHISTAREDRQDNEAKAWLERAGQIQRRAMYDRATNFTRATSEGDRDYAAFGACAISCELNHDRTSLLYRCWHLRDMAWCEGYDGKIDTIHRKWKPSATVLSQTFGEKKLHPKLLDKMKKEPYYEVNCRHVVIPANKYSDPSQGSLGTMPGQSGGRKWRTPYVSIYYDEENMHVLEEVGVWNTIYAIPRWATRSGSQYPYSPATIVSLPDARLLQAMSLTLLEAGEKAANPPMVATEEVVRSDIQTYAGGITWVDASYDERLGEALRPITQDKSGLGFGLSLREDVQNSLTHGMFLNQLRMPQVTKEMTAYETSQVVQEYIRQALPIIEPTEAEYNGALSEITFDTLFRAGAFGSPADIPESIRGDEIRFKFESPLNDSIEGQKMQTFLEAKGAIAEASALDPSSAAIMDAKEALRDVLEGIRTPAKWLRNEEQMEEITASLQDKQKADEMLAGLEKGGIVAEQVGKGGKAMQEMAV